MSRVSPMAKSRMADPRFRRYCRRVLLALTLGAGLPAMPGPAGAERPAGVALDYEVFAGGLRIARSDVELRLGDRSYTIALNAAPQGLLRWFSDWSFSAASNGA